MNRDLIVKPQKKEAKQKLTVVVSKKVAKKAVDRNRIRRIIKEAVRQLNYRKGLVIIVKNNIADLKTQEITRKLTQLIESDSG